jgi:zinc transport system substrate-binding protein
VLARTGAHATPDVVVTLKPLHALVAAVMEGVGTPHLLIDSAASPHTYAMKPSEVRRLNHADMIVRVSKRLEIFLDKPLSLVSRESRIVTIDEETPGLTLLALRNGGDFEPHLHDNAADGHSHAHPVHADAHDAHDHAAHVHTDRPTASDPHLWLDPRNAKAIALHLADVLAEAIPSAAERLKHNGQALAARLDRLDSTLAGDLEPVSGRRFLVFHDGYQYFEHRYGLADAGSVTINPEVPPSARRLSEIRARLAKANIVCVFAEPQFAPRAIGAIVEGTSVRQGTLDPLGASIEAGPAQYFALMEGLARDLKSCLGGAG